MRRTDFRDFGGPTCHSHLCEPSRLRCFEIACRTLEYLAETVQANRGSGGVDGQRLEGFPSQLDPQLDRLQSELRERILTGHEGGKPGYKARTIQRATAPVSYPARGHRGSPRPEIAANRPCPRWFLRILSAGACRGAHAECWSKRRRGQIRQHWRGPSW